MLKQRVALVADRSLPQHPRPSWRCTPDNDWSFGVRAAAAAHYPRTLRSSEPAVCSSKAASTAPTTCTIRSRSRRKPLAPASSGSALRQAWIAELQIDGGPYNHLFITKRSPAPLANLVTATGDSTNDVEDLVVATKIRLFPEGDTIPRLVFASPPACQTRATKAASASTRPISWRRSLPPKRSSRFAWSGTSVRLPLGPLAGDAQNDVLIYGVSVARAVTDQAEMVAAGGWASVRQKRSLPGHRNTRTAEYGCSLHTWTDSV